ncbi:hypothetical protein CEXT_403321 [Caerostris extrusa]|uniref:Uncharacterized protein n=1 Tax=Caerostris extrusa TaxID=172846 RepID=A0AAV4R2B6_CAEEX|nr:hypothetical protein CEXT_403321 [Caerostris extrusa]
MWYPRPETCGTQGLKTCGTQGLKHVVPKARSIWYPRPEACGTQGLKHVVPNAGALVNWPPDPFFYLQQVVSYCYSQVPDTFLPDFIPAKPRFMTICHSYLA